MNLLKTLQEVYEGEQNRYGEIEYKLSEKERMHRIDLIVDYLKSNKKMDSKESKKLSAVIYWGLHDTYSMVEYFLKAFIPLFKIPAVRNGFAKRFEQSLTLDARITYASNTLRDIQNFGLETKHWVSMAIEESNSWPLKDKEKEEYKNFMETLLRID